MHSKRDPKRPSTPEAVRKRYSSPKLTRYGAVNSLSRSGISTMSEGSPTLRKP